MEVLMFLPDSCLPRSCEDSWLHSQGTEGCILKAHLIDTVPSLRSLEQVHKYILQCPLCLPNGKQKQNPNTRLYRQES